MGISRMSGIIFAGTLSTLLLCSCGDSRQNKEKNTTEQKAPIVTPTTYKILDIQMGMTKKDLLSKGFDCSSLDYTGFCETYTHPEGNSHYRSVSKNGTINGILAYLDKNGAIYRIDLDSRHTNNNTDIEQFKTTLSQLQENNPNIKQSLEVHDSQYFQGAHFVKLSTIDIARQNTFDAQKNNASNKDASDIKNFGKK